MASNTEQLALTVRRERESFFPSQSGPLVRIAGRPVGEGQRVFVIAEIGINHNGSLEICEKLIEGAARAGCDAVKLQKRTPELCVPLDQWNVMRDTPWGRLSYIEYKRKIELGVINQTIEFLPIVLLGAAPEVALIKATLDAVWGMYIHSNVNVRSGLLQRVINGPEMHRWHHATELPIPGRNFATKLAIWDWLFGTAYLPPNKPGRYGLSDAAYPRKGFFAYLRQHLYSVRRSKEVTHG